MTDPAQRPWQRQDVVERSARDVERRRRREGSSRFWHALGLIGSVGWPIVLLATGGAMLGRAIDARWATGIRFTLMLLTLGVSLGTWAAFRAVRGPQ